MATNKTNSTTNEEKKIEQQKKELNYFEVLNSVNVNDKVEKKNGLSYLSWAWAWGELKKRFPDAIYTIYENADGWNYHTDGRTCWVKTGVTVNGVEHIEELPVMDYKNKAIPLGNVTSFEVNKTIQRSLTKAVARHGLGLYIYAGEDLPEATDGTQEPPKAEPKKTVKKAAASNGEKTVEAAAYSARQALKEFIVWHGMEDIQQQIIQTCGLNSQSTAADYEAALEYCRGLVR